MYISSYIIQEVKLMLNDMWSDGGRTPDPYFSDELDTALIDYMLSLQEKLDDYQYVTSVDTVSYTHLTLPTKA